MCNIQTLDENINIHKGTKILLIMLLKTPTVKIEFKSYYKKFDHIYIWDLTMHYLYLINLVDTK